LCPIEYRDCATLGGWVTPKKLVFLGVLGLNKLSRPTVLTGLSRFLVILQNAPILKFSRAIFCNFYLEPKLWRHKWRHFRFCKSCCRAMWFSPLDSSEDFMGQGGLRFSLSVIVSDIAVFVLKRDVKLQLTHSLSVIVSKLWRHQWWHNERCGLHPRPWTT